MLMKSIPTIICAILLVAIFGAVILSESFREDILVGSGEAKVLGILTVSGAAFVVLVGLLLGGLLLSVRWMWKYPHEEAKLRASRTKDELVDAWNKTYPELRAVWKIEEEPADGEELDLEYVKVPMQFAETFILDRKLANKVRRSIKK
jgi:hypothetical protein